MTKMSRYALINALAMFLAGCEGQREPAPVEEVKPAPEQPAEPHQPVPTVPSVPPIPHQPGPIEHENHTAPPPPPI
ncbi:MAG TPA: penicillin-binding protein activator LpoB, partial [Shigella sp.]|nr:penicillin-binding protein activator LpoB [Shigella sp.]